MKKRIFSYLMTLLLGTVLVSADNYQEGVFVLNEDWLGHNNSSLNFWRPSKGTVEYNMVQNANIDQTLGCTAQYAQLWNGRLYVIAKQDRDPSVSSDISSGRIVIVNASTMHIEGTITTIATNDKGQSIADGRSFVGVTAEKGYVGTSNGIYVMNLLTNRIERCITGTENPLIQGGEVNSNGAGPLYQHQIGMMIATAGRVFAIQQDKGVLVIDPATDAVVETIEGCFSTMCLAKDGRLFVGTNTGTSLTYPYGVSGEAWNGEMLTVIDPLSLTTSTIDLSRFATADYRVTIPSSWFAWNAGSLCADSQRNILYFTCSADADGQQGRFGRGLLFSYDIDADVCQLVYDAHTEGVSFYGCDVRVNPADGHLFCTLYPTELGNTSKQWVYLELDADGQEIHRFLPIAHYWYPALLIFPEDAYLGIEDLEDNRPQTTTQHAIYDLSGRRVSHPTRGIYIRNGKQYVVSQP